MYFNAVAIATGLTLALAPSSVLGWAQAADGTWVANNHVYPKVGGCKSHTYRVQHPIPPLHSGCSSQLTNHSPIDTDDNVHESCTRMNSEIVLTEGKCSYWSDGNGNMGHGCKLLPPSISFLLPPPPPPALRRNQSSPWGDPMNALLTSAFFSASQTAPRPTAALSARGAAPTPSPSASTPRRTAAASWATPAASARWAATAGLAAPTASALPLVALLLAK